MSDLSPAPQIDEVRIEQGLTDLEGAASWSPRVVSKLEMLLRTGDDFDLFRVNPLRYADQQGIEEREAIDLFLHAVNVGLFDLDWLIVCGACSNVFNSFRKLESLDPHFTCTLCSNVNEADLDEFIQVTFTVSPDVRDIAFHHPESLSVEDLYFRYHFSADVRPLPSGLTVPETLQKWTKLLSYVEPGESVSVDLDLPPGMIGLWDVMNPIIAMFLATPGHVGGTDLDLEVENGKLTELNGKELGPYKGELPEGQSLYMAGVESGADPDEVDDRGEPDALRRTLAFDIRAIAEIPTGPVQVRVRNGGDNRASAWIVQYPPLPEEAAFVEFHTVLTAKKLLSNQTFRQLFRSETVPASEALQVKDLTYMFTDLKDSTLMYDTVGDVNAYDLVRRHFDALVQTVADHSGAVVKTIGDSIMATFVSTVDSVRAAIDIHKVLAEFSKAASTSLIVKIGIHRGRSLAVTLNDRIDYFGQDVNIASRIQQLAGAGEIVVSETVYLTPGIEELFDPERVSQEDGIMKGVADMIPVFRVRATDT